MITPGKPLSVFAVPAFAVFVCVFVAYLHVTTAVLTCKGCLYNPQGVGRYHTESMEFYLR